MGFGKDVFCDGIDIYNLVDTGEIVSSITTCVGQSTASGPKVAIRRNKPFPTEGERIHLKSKFNHTRKDPTMEQNEVKENPNQDAKEVCEDEEICIVRRLTTTECERLMGFPDNHLKPMGGDSAQYRGAGNSWAVNCARFVMSRIHIVAEKMGVK